MTLPEISYHVFALWPDGDLIACETLLSKDPATARDDAFDVAAEMIKNGCDVRVEMVERSADRQPLLVSEVTAQFLSERGALQPSENGWCGNCERMSCTCDDAYEARVADDLHGWAAE